MRKHILLIMFLIAGSISVRAQNPQTPQSKPSQPQPKTTIKGGVGPAYIEHHIVTRTHWHARPGVQYHEVDATTAAKKKQDNPGNTPLPSAKQNK